MLTNPFKNFFNTVFVVLNSNFREIYELGKLIIWEPCAGSSFVGWPFRHANPSHSSDFLSYKTRAAQCHNMRRYRIWFLGWILVSPNLNFNIFCEFQFPYFKLCRSRNEVHFQQIPGNPEITNRFLPSFLPNECCRLSSPNFVRSSETALQNRHKSSRCGKCIVVVALWVTLCDLHSSDHRRHRFTVLG